VRLLKRRKRMSHITYFPAIRFYEMVIRGEMSLEEWKKLSPKDLKPVIKYDK
jgi:hypothetical protein